MELKLEDSYGTGTVKFWLRRDQGMGRKSYFTYNEGGLVTETLQDTCAVNILLPFIELSDRFAFEFIRLIADYANENGIKTEKQSFIEGELIATKKHLEDLQKAFNALIKP